MHGLFGVITYRRAYYVTGTGKGWAPLDEQLGIKLRHTPGCQYFLSNFSARQPYVIIPQDLVIFARFCQAAAFSSWSKVTVRY